LPNPHSRFAAAASASWLEVTMMIRNMTRIGIAVAGLALLLTSMPMHADTWDKAIDWDLRQASTVMAVSALELANLTGMIPRGQRTTPPVVAATKVSPELLRTK
jgi:hypothetical protein